MCQLYKIHINGLVSSFMAKTIKLLELRGETTGELNLDVTFNKETQLYLEYYVTTCIW
jgi:hypothetical protein